MRGEKIIGKRFGKNHRGSTFNVKKYKNGGSKNAGIVTLKKLCNGLEISLFDFFNTETFKTLEQEIK